MTRTLSDRFTPSGLPGETFLAGSSRVMQDLRAALRSAAQVDFRIRIEGESGTGKGLAARLLHRWSPRARGPFHRQSLATLPPGLEHGQLFGWGRGAFTGAVGEMPSVLELAYGGTLFLDEIACGSTIVQRALLQLLEDPDVVRAGETRARRIDVRFLFATNANLELEVAAGRFRVDLLFRMGMLVIRLPRLRDHIEDLPELVHVLLPLIASRGRTSVCIPSKEEMKLLEGYSWPGNVRELEAVLAYYLTLHHLPEWVNTAGLSERERIELALKRTGDNKRKAARELGMAPGTLYRRLEAPSAGRDTQDPGKGD
jgi:DNA-binding NtrC family response regulator